jgi:hypothetical protein
MLAWWHRDVIAAGKLPPMLCFVSYVVTFASTRTITRLIRDGRGPFRNVAVGGTHVHHSVPGIILLMIGAFTAVGGPGTLGWLSFSAIAVGIGTSLVLDEFAMILHLQDVYWSGEGQLSVEAVSLVAACLGLALVGFSPVHVNGIDSAEFSLRPSGPSARCGWPGPIRSGRGTAIAASVWSAPPAGPRPSTAAGNPCRRAGWTALRTAPAAGWGWVPR